MGRAPHEGQHAAVTFGLRLLILVALALASAAAALHATLVQMRLARAPAALPPAPFAHFGTYCACWFARCGREMLPLLLRTPLGRAALSRTCAEGVPGPAGGCLVATIHSPWARVLAARCRNGVHLAFAADNWNQRLGAAHVGSSFAAMHRLLRHLRHGGVAFTMIDVFPRHGGCAVRFLGAQRRVSTVPARIASAAAVPILPAVVVVRDGRLEIEYGSLIASPRGAEELLATTRELAAWADGRIRSEPAIWNGALRGALHPSLKA